MVCPTRAPPLIRATFPRGSTARPQDAAGRSIGGRFRCQEVISWKNRAREIPLSSSNAEVIAVRLTGRPPLPQPPRPGNTGRPPTLAAADRMTPVTLPNGNSGSFVSSTRAPARGSSSRAARKARSPDLSPCLSKSSFSQPIFSRLTDAGSDGGAGRSSDEYGSSGSRPWMRSRTSSQSLAERAIGPSLSSDQESAIAPCRDTRPNVGRSPETPQKDDGHRIDPQVSEPMANGTRPAATAAPAPDDEPHVQT